MAKNEHGLTPKQEAFALEYLKDLNQTAAAMRAGYSAHTANEKGAQLMAIPAVKARVQTLMSERASRVKVEVDEVLRLALEVARVDIGKIFDNEGRLLHPNSIDEETRRAIASIEVYEEFDFQNRERVQVGQTKKIKFWDKMKSIELLMKHLGILTVKHEHSGAVTLEQIVAESGEGDEE